MRAKKPVNMEIKQINRTSVYRLLWEKEALTKQDLVLQLQLCLPTVTQNLKELAQEGLVAESGFVGHTGGRRARTYSIAANARTAIGLDVTKHHITAVAVDLRGRVICHKRIQCDFSRTDGYYRELGAMVEAVIADAGLCRAHILGVGIGVPGLITQDHEKVFYGQILHFKDATRAEFSQYIPFPTALFNDANASGFAEQWADPGLVNAFYLMLSNNVGGAILLGRQLVPGENLRGGEVGHTVIVPGGRACYCGNRGCVDAYCAATVLSGLADGNLALFFERLHAGDAVCAAAWREYLVHLAAAVNNLRMLLDCRVILGGYVGRYLDEHLPELRALAAPMNSFEDNADYLVACRYKNEPIAAGAALEYISRFLDTI